MLADRIESWVSNSYNDGMSYGKQEGISIGKQEGQFQAAKVMLQQKFGKLSKQQLKTLKQKIEQDYSEVFSKVLNADRLEQVL